MTHYHPRLNDKGSKVPLHQPSQPTALPAWEDPLAVATVTPGAPMPPALNGIPFASWQPPADHAAWTGAAESDDFEEPDFKPPPGKKPASGSVILEPDGRVWLVAPSNGFGGYQATFPKGRVEHGLNRRATAIKEAFEESGLHVRLTGFLIDSDRTTTYTRYYRAERLGGNPADMGWESQAVHLVPRSQLDDVLNSSQDRHIINALPPSREEALEVDQMTNAGSLGAGNRLVMTVDGFRQRFGYWPSRLILSGETLDSLQHDIFSERAWSMLNARLSVSPGSEGMINAEGLNGERFEYDGKQYTSTLTETAAQWIWGCRLL